MKYITLTILLTLVLAFAGCTQEEAIDYEKEKAAIIEVINKETNAYLERDFETVYSTHVHDSLNMRATAGPNNYVFLEGWEEVSGHLASDETEDDLSPGLHITAEKSNFRMKIFPRSAFVVCDQVWTSKFDDDVTEINTIQIRFMEKIDGEWKIAYVSWIDTSAYPEMEETERLN